MTPGGDTFNIGKFNGGYQRSDAICKGRISARKRISAIKVGSYAMSTSLDFSFLSLRQNTLVV